MSWYSPTPSPRLNIRTLVLSWVIDKGFVGVPQSLELPRMGHPSSVSPLKWNHSTVVATVQEYLQNYELLRRGCESVRIGFSIEPHRRVRLRLD